ncbi:aminotransferase class I/II-fold pyridoxal phosphate-dependent enzyme, partial [bacterium]|nr:aminotransferase class I/II-fold pyridoxal phosphate-dependent enzyme [bacterium]
EFQKRRNFLLHKLRSIPDVSVNTPEGAFYVFPNFSAYFNKEFEGMLIRNSHGLTYYLLKHAHVAVTAGDDFGADDFIRLSYANSMDNITEAMERIIEAVSKLKTPSKVRRTYLNNTITTVKKKTAIEIIDMPTRDDLFKECEANLSHDGYYEWNANINGVIVQLRTNIDHLYDFWLDNWYPAQLETDLEPHGIIYALGNIKGKDPHAYYNSETKTGIIQNTDFYETLRTLAITLVSDVSQTMLDVYNIRAMSIDINGKGALLIGPKGTKKTEHFFGLLQMDNAKLHSSDMMLVRTSGKAAVADNPERKVFMPTGNAHIYFPLGELFERSKCENVIISKEDCTNKECLIEDNCDLEKGAPFCFKASKKSHVLIDPYWLGGPQKHTKRTTIKWIFLLASSGAAISNIPIDEMLHKLETSFSDKAGSDSTEIFYNPYLILKTPERIQMQRRFFRQLLDNTKCFVVNSGGRPFNEVQGILRDTITKK